MEVNKVIYILLAVFLGSFGIHKFLRWQIIPRNYAHFILLDSYPSYLSYNVQY